MRLLDKIPVPSTEVAGTAGYGGEGNEAADGAPLAGNRLVRTHL